MDLCGDVQRRQHLIISLGLGPTLRRRRPVEPNDAAKRKRPLFVSVPYVCPEPVLVKLSVLV
jgi:hypothetical protein